MNKIRSKSNFILKFALPKAREGVVNVWNCYITAVGINGIKSFDLHIIIMYPFYVQQASPKIKSTFKCQGLSFGNGYRLNRFNSYLRLIWKMNTKVKKKYHTVKYQKPMENRRKR